MMYHAITKDDMKNGNGLRVVLWVAGCQHKCPGCHNPQTWEADRGEPFTEWEEAELFRLLKQDHISGITFSGGDPLHPANRDEVGRIAKAVKKMGKNVWLYTGYLLEHSIEDGFFFTDLVAKLDELPITELPWLSYVDVLVDGRYMEDIRKEDIRKNADPHWRGSSNQRLIDVQKSLRRGHIVHMDGMVESNNVLYNSIIKRYVEFGELVDSPEQMLKLLNILEAHEETLEGLHSLEEGQQFCHAWPSSCKDEDIVSVLFEQNKFFYDMADFISHYDGQFDEQYASEGTFYELVDTGDILITSDGYVHVNIA